jgi:hypothetical protein
VGGSRTRKRVNELTAADLSSFAVWEFALDDEGEEGQDETTVRPVTLRGKLDPSDGMFVVRARFVLADGTSMRGYLTPSAQAMSDLGTLQPVIITERGQVLFWHGTLAPSLDELVESYARLGGRSAAQVFPIRFESDVSMLGGPIHAELRGFIVVTDPVSMRTKVVK